MKKSNRSIYVIALSADTGEANDLVQAHSVITKGMQQELYEWYAEVDAHFLQPKPQSAESPWRQD